MGCSSGLDRKRGPGATLLLLLGLFAALTAVPVAALVVAHGFSGLYGQDSFFYQTYSTGTLRDALTSGQAPPGFTWPPGYPLLIAVVSVGAGTGSLPGQVVSLLAGASVPVFAILLARELWPDRAWWMPWLAGGIVALTPHLWQSSAVVMSDTTGLAFATLGAWGVARYARHAQLRWALLAAAAIALAVATRWVYALVAVPLAVAGFSEVARRRLPLHAVLAVATGILVFAPVGVPMAFAAVAGSPIPFSVAAASHTWDPANALRSTFDGPSGRFDFQLSMGLYYLLQPAQPYHLGPLFTLLAIPGLIVTLREATIVRVALLVSWPLLVLGLLAGDTTQNTRFFLAALPPVAILAGIGFEAVLSTVSGWAVRARRAARTTITLAVLVGLVAQGVAAAAFTDSFIARQQAEQDGIAALADQVPSDARLIAFGATLALRHAGRTDTLELYDQDPTALVAMVADGRPTYLIVPVDTLAAQWAASPPGRSLIALRDGPGLVTLDQIGAYRLDRVVGPVGNRRTT